MRTLTNYCFFNFIEQCHFAHNECSEERWGFYKNFKLYPTTRSYSQHGWNCVIRTYGSMFIAQAYGIELTFTEQIIGVLTGLLASIGAAGIPMAGLVMISVVLSAMGLPLEGVGLILAVDRILDMFRTTVNVWSDSCGAVIIAKSEGEKLKV